MTERMRRAWLFLTVTSVAACSGGDGATPTDSAVRDASEVFNAGSAADDDVIGAPVDAATVHTAAPDAGVFQPGMPLTAPANTWTWVGFPDALCANGTPTGIGVNLLPGAHDVMIFLQGGGACWDGTTCWGPVSTSFYVATGYGPVEFSTDALLPAMLPLRRDDPTNPFANLNLVYVPYCTGDVHAGDNVAHLTYNGVDHATYFVGYRNLGIYLQRIVPTFPDARRVILAGDSAGGFGSALNMDRVQQVFPNARVDVLDDSGQPIEPDPARWAAWDAAWHIQLPADCPACETDVTASADYLRQKYPNNRFGLISYSHDSVITTFMNLSPASFSSELQALGDSMDANWPHGHYYFIPGVLHVGLLAPGPGLLSWLDAFASDSTTWASFRIPGL